MQLRTSSRRIWRFPFRNKTDKRNNECRMSTRLSAMRHFSFLPCNPKSAIEIRNSGGGIAQLVERQLCKLEVRGSNPLASKASKAWRQNLTTGHIFGCASGSVIPLPPFSHSENVAP